VKIVVDSRLKKVFTQHCKSNLKMFCKRFIQQFFVFHLTITNIFTALPIFYDKQSGLIKIHEESKFRYKILSRIALTYTFTLNLQTFFAHRVQLWLMVMSWFLCGCFIVACLLTFILIQKLADIVQLTNRMFKFEQLHHTYFGTIWEFKKARKCKTLLFLEVIGSTCAQVCGLAFWVFILLIPCFPGNFSYQLHSECGTFQHTGMALKILLSFVSSLLLACMGANIAFVNTQLVFVFCFCYQNYVKYSQYLLSMIGSKMGRKILKIGETRLQILTVYRQIQLLVQQYNSIHQHFIVVLMLVLASSGLTFSLYILITLLGTNAGLVETMFFLAIGLDCFLIIGVLSGMEGCVYTTSMETKKTAQKNLS